MRARSGGRLLKKGLGLVKARLLGGSWVVISGVISPRIWVISVVTPLIAPLATTHEPPSRGLRIGFCSPCFGYCPHTVTVYNRATIKGLIYPYYEYYSTVTEWGQYPTHNGIREQQGNCIRYLWACFGDPMT